MKTKKKKTLSHRFFVAFLLFSVIVLVVTGLMQTVFLDKIYAMVKQNTLNNAMTSIISSTSFEEEDVQELCENIASYYDVCVLVTTDEMQVIGTAEGTRNCGIHKMSHFELARIYNSAVTNGGTYSATIQVTTPGKPDPGFGKDDSTMPFSDANSLDLYSLLEVSVIESDTEGTIVVFVNTVITPVNDIVQTNKITITIISAVMLIMSIVISAFLSKKMSRPIIEMNNEATKLAKSEFDVSFEQDSGVMELDELGDKLNYAANELSKVDTLRNELVANVSHDLRTPLTLISGYSEMMRDIPGEDTAENLDLIIDETKRLSTMVNDILDVSRYRSGTYTLSFEEFSLTEEVNRTITRIAQLTEQKGYEFRFLSDVNANVVADRTAIGRVIYNLIGNALNYATDNKLIEITQTCEDGRVKIEIKDHGKGIAPEELPYVFERYYRASQNHVRAVLGSGLGLSIVKSILESHDAHFGVTSALGDGSTFWFSLELADKPNLK